jgi:hypothetical protein
MSIAGRRTFLWLSGAAMVRGIVACGHSSSGYETPEAIRAVDGTVDELAERVDDHIRDPQRKETVAPLVDAVRAELQKLTEAMAQRVMTLAEYDDEQLADRKAVERELDEATGELALGLTQLSMRAAEARRSTTNEEWNLIFRTGDRSMVGVLLSTLANAVGLAGSLGGVNVRDRIYGQWDDALDKTAKDDAARSKAKASVMRIRELANEQREMMQKDLDDLAEVNLSYAAPLEAYAPLIERLRGNVNQTHKGMLDEAFAIREAISDKAFSRTRRRVAKAISAEAKDNAQDARRRKKASKKMNKKDW